MLGWTNWPAAGVGKTGAGAGDIIRSSRVERNFFQVCVLGETGRKSVSGHPLQPLQKTSFSGLNFPAEKLWLFGIGDGCTTRIRDAKRAPPPEGGTPYPEPD